MRLKMATAMVLAGMWVTDWAHAAVVKFRFTTTVQMVNPSAPGFPASLSNVSVGDQVVGRVRYESTSPTMNNTFPSPYSLATLYGLVRAQVSFTIDGVVMDTWSGQMRAFVWNNDNISGSPSDGLILTNITSPGLVQFQVGNLLLPTSTFANESLPSSNQTGGYLMDMRSAGSTAWLQTNTWSGLTFVPACTADAQNDGFVNVADLLTVISAWGTCANCPSTCMADVSPPGGDCAINVADLLAVISAWGVCP